MCKFRAIFFSAVDEKPYHLNTLTVVRVERVMGKVGGLFITTRMRDTYIFLYILILKMILKKRRIGSLEEKS